MAELSQSTQSNLSQSVQLQTMRQESLQLRQRIEELQVELSQRGESEQQSVDHLKKAGSK